MLFARSKGTRHDTTTPRAVLTPGAYVGPAIFQPKRRNDLRPDLRPAIGQSVELVFVSVAGPDERCAGQNIYMERPGSRGVLRGAWVADEDVRFIDPARMAAPPENPVVSARFDHPGNTIASNAPLILLVDDTRDTRELYSFVMTGVGFEVIHAEDGVTAIEIARSVLPNAIVMDLDLPRLNGLEAIQLLRADAATCYTPILVFTAHGEAAAAEAVKAGANAVALKPCLPDAFMEALTAILPFAGEVEQIRR